MKKQALFVRGIIIVLSLMLFSCSNLTKDKNAIDSDKLKGVYKIERVPLANYLIEEVGIIARLALSSFGVNVDFYDNNSGVIELNWALVDIANTYGDKPIGNKIKFSYKIENDSIFYIRVNKDDEYQKVGVVRKLVDNYDRLQFSINTKMENRTLNLYLSRIKE